MGITLKNKTKDRFHVTPHGERHLNLFINTGVRCPIRDIQPKHTHSGQQLKLNLEGTAHEIATSAKIFCTIAKSNKRPFKEFQINK